MYSDALASGNTTVYAERKKTKNEEIVSLRVGNLLLGQSAVIDIQTMCTLQVASSCHDFNLEVAWFSNYKTSKMMAGSKISPEYTY